MAEANALDVSPESIEEGVDPLLQKEEVNSQKLKAEKSHKTSPQEEKLNDICDELFKSMAKFLQGEITGSVAEYKLLENMNIQVTQKYKGLKDTAQQVDQAMHIINHQFSDLQPYLQQIDNIEASVVALEKNAYRLDSYAKRLEEKFRSLEKK